MNQSHTALSPQAFGVIIPGGFVRTDFQPSDASGMKFALGLSGISGKDISTISELVFFLLPGVSLPHDHGAILYWQIVSTPAPHGATLTSFLATPTKTEFELVGAIANHKPSGVFRTGWSTNETLSSAINSPCGSIVTVNLGVSIEPLGNITNVGAMPDRTVHVAKNIALDLFNYMQSFDSGGGGAGNMVVPKNVFDRWMARFESKFRLDPNFFNKN